MQPPNPASSFMSQTPITSTDLKPHKLRESQTTMLMGEALDKRGKADLKGNVG